jgi:hypothetical protein
MSSKPYPDIMVGDSEERDVWRAINLKAMMDETLSWKAKGLYYYIMTRPEGWKIWVEDLKKRSTDGETAVRSGIKELMASKYLYRVAIRGDQKQFIQWVFVVFITPKDRTDQEVLAKISPLSGFPEVAQPEVGFQGYRYKEDRPEEGEEKELFPDKNRDFHQVKAAQGHFAKENKPNKPILLRRRVKYPAKYYLSRIEEEKPKTLYSEEASRIVEHWNKKTSLISHQYGKAPYEKSAKAVDRALEKHSSKTILMAIDKYDELFSMKDLSINSQIPGHRVSFYEFLNGFDINTKERMERRDVEMPFTGTWFAFLRKEPAPESFFADIIEDEKPQITNTLKRRYTEKFLGGLEPEKGFTPKEENLFRRGAIKFFEFVRKNNRKVMFTPEEIRRPQNAVHYVFEALEGKGMTDVSPGIFASNFMFDNLLPRHLNNIGASGSISGSAYSEQPKGGTFAGIIDDE